MASDGLVEQGADLTPRERTPRDNLFDSLNADGDVRLALTDIPTIGAACVLSSVAEAPLSCSIWLDREGGWRCDVAKLGTNIESPSIVDLQKAAPWHRVLWGEAGEELSGGQRRGLPYATFNQMTRRMRRLGEVLSITGRCDPLRLPWPPEIVDRMAKAHILDAVSTLIEFVRLIHRHVGILELRDLSSELARHVDYLLARWDRNSEAPDGDRLITDFATNVNLAIAGKLSPICLILAALPASASIAPARPHEFLLNADHWANLIGMPINLELASFGLMRERVAYLPKQAEREGGSSDTGMTTDTTGSIGPVAGSRGPLVSGGRRGLNALDKLYHLHIPKTAGTSINHFIAMAFAEFEVTADHFLHRSWEHFCNTCLQQDADAARDVDERRLSDRAFDDYDCVAGHYHFLQCLPSGARAFCLLRDPVSRMSSHVRDWNRIARDSDPGRLHGYLYECLRDKRIDVDYALRRSAVDTDLNFLFRNHQAKCLLSSYYGLDELNGFDDGRLYRESCEVMDDRFDFVGIADEPLAAVRRLSELMGWPKPRHLSRLNLGDPTGTPWTASEEERLVPLNEVDHRLYQRARKVWSRWIDRAVEPEEERANALRWLMGKDGQARTEGDFTANDRVLGGGWHGRDMGGTLGAQIWSGPSSESFFYVSLPPGRSGWLRVALVPHDRLAPEMLRVIIDDETAGAERKLNDTNTYVFSARFPSGAARVTRVDVHCGTMVSDADDARPRGAALAGWRVDTSSFTAR